MMSWNPTLRKLQSVRSSGIVNSKKPHVNSEWVDEDWLSYFQDSRGERLQANEGLHCAGWLGILGASMASIHTFGVYRAVFDGQIRAEGQNLPITRGVMMLWPIPILRRDTRADLDPLLPFTKDMGDTEFNII